MAIRWWLSTLDPRFYHLQDIMHTRGQQLGRGQGRRVARKRTTGATGEVSAGLSVDRRSADATLQREPQRRLESVMRSL